MPSESGGDPDPAGVERLEKVDEPLADGAEDVLLGHNRVLEDELAGIARAPAHLVLLLAGPDALGLRDVGRVPDAQGTGLVQIYVSLVTMKLVMPLLPRPGSVRAVTEKISPTPAWVMKIFEPFNR
jgi:hypothetical protein